MTDKNQTTDILVNLRDEERRNDHGLGGLLACAIDEIERLRRGLNEVRDFLNKPEWGTYQYMEGTEVYEDKDTALFNIAYALGETDANS